MNFRSPGVRAASVVVLIIAVLLVSTLISGWHWTLLIPAAFIAVMGWIDWRRQLRGEAPHTMWGPKGQNPWRRPK
jgi:predicted tellurium resistance membrane protein TerC